MPTNVVSLDIVTGGDHGQGAFIVGSKDIIHLREPIPEGDSSDLEEDIEGNNKTTRFMLI